MRTAAAWHCTHKPKDTHDGRFLVISPRSPVLVFRLLVSDLPGDPERTDAGIGQSRSVVDSENRHVLTSRIGGWPKKRLYSRLN